jgi:uncharacterized RDD family membrane protein YckC
MFCSRCGDICECSSKPGHDVSSRDDSGAVVSDPETAPQLSPEVEGTPHANRQAPAAAAAQLPENGEASKEESSAWRGELALRLNRYQSRRKPRPPRYPSLLLRFDAHDSGRSPAEPSGFLPVSNQALALDEFSASVAPPADEARNLPDTRTVQENLPLVPGHALGIPPSYESALAPPVTARIIEFPRSWTPPPPRPDELAEPVDNSPRILEAPEFSPPPPALGGITIEPVQQPEIEKRPGIDIPLQTAPLGQRVLSALIDDVIIAAACALFGYIFWKLTAIRPPRLPLFTFVAGLAGVFWAAYQYLLLVHAGSTPGLRLARLELTRFDGSPAGRGLRRWRVLASYLSAISLGMGYVWAFLDEDALCWHDRITHTYLAPRGR